MEYSNSLSFALKMDKEDPLGHFRDQFHIPLRNGHEVRYFTGNSLGLQPKTTWSFVQHELEQWQKYGVDGHTEGDKPWLYYHKLSKKMLASLTGSSPGEVLAMNSLTTNLHLLLVSFYRPTTQRFKIITEAGAFPSDQYALETQVRFHGFDPDAAIIEINPREGEVTLQTEDIISTIEKNASSLALVMISGVQYYTGQRFDIRNIAGAAKKAGAFVGFDLAHAIGNVTLNLHDDNVDFATWCSYKYLNAGPGAVGGIFVHDSHGHDKSIPRFAGWWGHDEDERFQMKKGFIPMPGVDGWQLSNVNILSSAALLASLDSFDNAGFTNLCKKRDLLTGYLAWLIDQANSIINNAIRIITPGNMDERGCQLSISLSGHGKEVIEILTKNNMVVDWREPHVIRVAPVPLYNTFSDVYQFVELLKASIKKGYGQ